MPGWIPPRLRSLLGNTPTDVTQERLESLLGLPEDHDLDYKRQRYDTGSQGARDAATDVAAFANASGGLLIIGIEEDGAGVASALVPDASSDDLGLWINQVVAARVSPTPTIGHSTVPIAGGIAHIISVAPSTRKPHAVSVGKETLRYPVRSGSTTRYMYEPEIADMYYRRVTGAINLELKSLLSMSPQPLFLEQTISLMTRAG